MVALLLAEIGETAKTSTALVMARAQQPATLFDHGGDRRSEAANQPVNHRLIEYGSGNAEYDTARIARDRPDILERMKEGDYPSVRAAARPSRRGRQGEGGRVVACAVWRAGVSKDRK